MVLFLISLQKKLMMQKLAVSERFDMMFDLDADPYEMNNMLGRIGMAAPENTIIQAEHMRCLLLGWMERLDGDVGYYSDPAANYGEGSGDIAEIRDRQSWRPIAFWTSASDTGILEMGNVAWNNGAFVRHEWLYMGTRQEGQRIRLSSLSITGANAGLFTVDESAPIEFVAKACVPIRVSFSSPTTLTTTPIDASIVIEWSEIDANGAAVYPLTTTIQLTMKSYNFDSSRLGYPPPPTLGPTLSPAPTRLPTARPTMAPVVVQTPAPVPPTGGAPQPTSAPVAAGDSQAPASEPTGNTTGTPSSGGGVTLTPVAIPCPDCETAPPASSATGVFSTMFAASVGCLLTLLWL